MDSFEQARRHFMEGLSSLTAGDPVLAERHFRASLDHLPDRPSTLTNLSAALLQQGRLEEAREVATRAIAIDPLAADARVNLGLAALADGQRVEAEGLADAVLARDPRHAGALGLSARAREAGDDLPAAAERWRQLAEAHPQDAAALSRLGAVLAQLGRFAEAQVACERALGLQPDDASAWSTRGIVLAARDRREEALACQERAVAIAPQAAEAWSNRGSVLHALKRHQEALADFDEAIRLRPDFAQAWTNRGVAQLALGSIEDALADHDEALRLEPAHAQAWRNRALALNAVGRFEEALESVGRAIECAPADHAARVARVAILSTLDRPHEGIPDFEESVRHAPGDPERRHDLSQLRLQCLDFARGWTDYEARFRTKGYNSPALTTSRPRWDGHRSASRLLVWGEQGLGDQILHGSMLQDLCSLPQPVTVAVDARLASLLQRSFPSLSVRGGLDALTESEYDEQVPIGSLGQTFRRSTADFAAAREAWLVPDPVRVAEVRACTGALPGPRVGVSWRSANARIGSDKSIELDRLAECLNAAGATLVDLQYDSTVEELEACRARTGVTVHRMPGVDLREDLEGVAAIIASCDLIVTISNTVAHMAGAIGRPTLLLLPRVAGRIWYWSEVDGRSLWYPSVRILRQSIQGDWREPLARACDWLREVR